MVLKPNHPVPGLYTDAATKKMAFIVDDFGNAIHLVSHRELIMQWSYMIVMMSSQEH